MGNDWQKYERNGQIAVLVSHGFGAGWSTWNDEHKAQMAMDRRFVELSISERAGDIEALVKEVFPDEEYVCVLGWPADVEWVDKGRRFENREYDGSESLHVFGQDDGMVA